MDPKQLVFQSTHPRGVRPFEDEPEEVQGHISIHAPARGATIGKTWTAMSTIDFNPRTREGCDRRTANRLATALMHFNPRTREGCDSVNWQRREMLFSISIHAPARGATRTANRLATALMHFNPRTREGCDFGIFTSVNWLFAFQSTHPRGVRRHSNPPDPAPSPISIHAPARGATLKQATQQIWDGIFQSTHPRGVRQRAANGPQTRAQYFNPRTREGCDRMWGGDAAEVTHFNPRTREGCDGKS